MSDDYDGYLSEGIEPKRPRDNKIDAAKARLMAQYFSPDATEVYYGRQLEIWLEKEFFHWITKKALNELVADRRVSFQAGELKHNKAHFYYSTRHRYPRRQIRETIGLIAEFSDPVFTRALGQHGELLVDAGLAYTRFRIEARKVKEVDGRKWIQSISPKWQGRCRSSRRRGCSVLRRNSTSLKLISRHLLSNEISIGIHLRLRS